MKEYKKALSYFSVWQLFFLLYALNAHASSSALYVAVNTGTDPGIWRVDDLNGDMDAMDTGETTQFVSVQPFMDLAVDENGIIYAIGEGTATVYRIEDLNSDDDADDPEEIRAFRDENAPGFKFRSPFSIATASYFDLDTMTTRIFVYIMDAALQYTARLQDLDGDGDAQDLVEVVYLAESTGQQPFTASHMTTDEVGRIIGCIPNNRSVVRLEDMNEDGSIIFDPQHPCPPSSCGQTYFAEYHPIRQYRPSQPLNLNDPFGVAVSNNPLSTSLICYISECKEAELRVIKLTDRNGDDDALESNEITHWGYAHFGSAASGDSASRSLYGYDIAAEWLDTHEREIIYVAQVNLGEKVISGMVDYDGDGDAMDSGEYWTYADFTSIGTPVGLALQRPSSRPMDITANLTDYSLMKGPLLVVEDGVTETLTINVSYQDAGTPAGNVRVGYAVAAGCFDLCPHSYRTHPDGSIEYAVTRTDQSPVGGEILKFWVFGDEVTIPIVSTPCNPGPVADAGPDQAVSLSQAVVLDGSGSTGPGLYYCWEQTEGPDVGLPFCDMTTALNPTITFTAPSSPSTLKFSLHIKNACDFVSSDEVVVDVDRVFILELDVTYEEIFGFGFLNLDYTIGTPESATWANFLILTNPTIQVIPLWTVPLPIIHPPMDLPISFPFTQLGMIGIYTGLFTATGPEDVELVWVDTGL